MHADTRRIFQAQYTEELGRDATFMINEEFTYAFLVFYYRKP